MAVSPFPTEYGSSVKGNKVNLDMKPATTPFVSNEGKKSTSNVEKLPASGDVSPNGKNLAK